MAVDGPKDPDDPDDPERPFSAVPDRPVRPASELERERPFGPRREYAPPEPDSPDSAREDRPRVLREIISDDSGNIIGIEDSRRVRLISRDQMRTIADEIRAHFGPPDVMVETRSGKVESWRIGPDRSWVTYRSYSKSGGATIDITRVPGLQSVKRFHEQTDETSD